MSIAIDTPTLDAAPETPRSLADRFTPATAHRLVHALRRFENGEFPNLDTTPARLLFAVWLIEQGRLTDELPPEGATTP
jgi:hypothetical protein